MDKKDTFYDIAIRNLSGATSDLERSHLAEFLEDPDFRAEYDLLNQWWQQSDQAHEIEESVKLRIQNKIQQSEADFSFKTGKTVRLKTWWMAAAVGLLAVCFSYFGFMSSSTKQMEVITKLGEVQQVILPDGSTVTLNENSTLSFPREFAGDIREISIEGEGFFEVKSNPQKPFIVHASNVETKVLGTKFNVCAYPDERDIKVALVEGKVSVSKEDSNQEPVILLPNQELTTVRGNGELKITEFDRNETIGWKFSAITFDNAAIKSVFTELEKRYGVTFSVKTEEILQCRVSITLDHESLKSVLETLEFINDIKFTSVNPTHYTVSGRGCM